jgi:4-amino-4-deoxy-L-arabinose transferase-like glycosyltransferase
VSTSPASPAPPALRLPAWAWAGLALALGFVYLRGIASDPLRWEEPRRALVAEEMILRGDFVVARLLGQPYLNKPPLQSWLIVLCAGGDAARVGPLAVRLPSVLAVAAIALILFLLGLSSTSGPHALPALVFLTFGIVLQYGRPGEMDLPFSAWVAAALGAFEWGRRRRSGARQWVLAQALVAGGVLTKGLAPLFFHPPALLTTWRRRLPLRPLALGAGLLVMLALVAAWVVPYARSGPAQALGARLASEVAQRTTDAGGGEALRHLARYPLVLLAAALPWSLALAGLVRPPARAALRGLLCDPWPALCAAAAGWGVAMFALVPGTLPRYLLPVLPAAAVLAAASLARLDRPSERAWPWLALGAAWAACAPLVAHRQLAPSASALPIAAAVAVLGLAAIAAAREVARRFGARSAALLSAGLLYGLAYAGVAEVRTAERVRDFERAAEALAARVRPGVPLVVAEGTDRRLVWPLAHRLRRLVVEEPPAPPYDLVGPAGMEVKARARLVAESGGFALWRVRTSPEGAAPPGGGGR